MRGQRLSTAEKTIRDYLDSPSMKLARDYLDGPAAKLAREHAESPAAQLASQIGVLTDQGAAAAKMAAIQKALEPPPGHAEELALIRPFAVEHDALAKIGAVSRPESTRRSSRRSASFSPSRSIRVSPAPQAVRKTISKKRCGLSAHHRGVRQIRAAAP